MSEILIAVLVTLSSLLILTSIIILVLVANVILRIKK